MSYCLTHEIKKKAISFYLQYIIMEKCKRKWQSPGDMHLHTQECAHDKRVLPSVLRRHWGHDSQQARPCPRMLMFS